MMLEVVLQVGGGEALHELDRLAQLDLDDHGEVAIAAEALEVQAGDPAQPLRPGRRCRPARPPFGDRVLHRALEDRDEQVVLAPEVEVDGAGGDAGDPGDVGDLRLEEAVCGRTP